MGPVGNVWTPNVFPPKNQAIHQDGSCTLVFHGFSMSLKSWSFPTNEKRLVKGEPGISPVFSVFKGNPKVDGSGNLFHLFMWEDGIIAIWTVHEFLVFRNGFRCYELVFLLFLPFWRLFQSWPRCSCGLTRPMFGFYVLTLDNPIGRSQQVCHKFLKSRTELVNCKATRVICVVWAINV